MSGTTSLVTRRNTVESESTCSEGPVVPAVGPPPRSESSHGTPRKMKRPFVSVRASRTYVLLKIPTVKVTTAPRTGFSFSSRTLPWTLTSLFAAAFLSSVRFPAEQPHINATRKNRPNAALHRRVMSIYLALSRAGGPHRARSYHSRPLKTTTAQTTFLDSAMPSFQEIPRMSYRRLLRAERRLSRLPMPLPVAMLSDNRKTTISTHLPVLNCRPAAARRGGGGRGAVFRKPPLAVPDRGVYYWEARFHARRPGGPHGRKPAWWDPRGDDARPVPRALRADRR